MLDIQQTEIEKDAYAYACEQWNGNYIAQEAFRAGWEYALNQIIGHLTMKLGATEYEPSREDITDDNSATISKNTK
jgi:hypothetical protein